MSVNPSSTDLEAADVLLSDLLNEVQKWEGTLAGGTKLGVGATAIDNLRQTQVGFGNPTDRLMRLTEAAFADSGAALANLYKQQTQFDFYSMTLTVALRAKPGVQFWRLSCELDFGPKGSQEPIVQTIFPTEKWRSVMNFGVGMDVGLDGNLDWSAGVDASQLAAIVNLLPGELKANAVSKNAFKAVVAIPAYNYQLGQSEITAIGEGNSTCYWRIQDQELQKLGTAKFAVVFKVPKVMEAIELRGTAYAEPNMSWLTADIRDVFGELSDRFKALLRQKNDAANQFARGTIETWTLNLPKS